MFSKIFKRNISYKRLRKDVKELQNNVNKLTLIVDNLSAIINKHRIDITSLYIEADYQNEKITKGFIHIEDEIFKMINYLREEIKDEVDALKDKK